uniref:Reverse transcriptase domain-containing protein n=1 Tax=Romanomermis culicivorax TaxID=13658 RepID=A0A915JTX5_ROMCU
MQKAFRGRGGVWYEDANSLTDLMFADDKTIFTNTDAEVTDILYDFTRNTQSYGLRINADKTKVLMTDESLASVHLDGIQIGQ